MVNLRELYKSDLQFFEKIRSELTERLNNIDNINYEVLGLKESDRVEWSSDILEINRKIDKIKRDISTLENN